MKKRIVYLLCIIALVSSCSKDENPEFKKTSLVVKRELTPEEVIMKEKLALTAQIVRDVIIEAPEVVKEVDGLINLGLYKDDFIFFKDLFTPEENPILKGSTTTSTKFGKVFDEILARKSNSNIKFDVKKFLVTSEITLYCPYPVDDYLADYQLPSCTSDPIDNEFENLGYQLQEDGSYSVVNINEKYSEEYPVWIVIQKETGSEISISTKQPTSPAKSSIHQLRVGHVRSTKQYDGIFSGGSEFKFCLLGGTINLTSATSFTALQTCFLSRADIRRGTWVNFQYELDDNWYVSDDGSNDEGARQFGLIEYDRNKREYTLSFEPKVKIDKIEVSAGKVAVTIVSEEGWIKLDNYLSRSTFKQFNKTDMGHGLKDGYRIYVAGEVYWTLPLIEY